MQGQCHQTCISHCHCSQYSHVSLFVPCLVKSSVSMFMIKHNRGCLVSSNYGMVWDKKPHLTKIDCIFGICFVISCKRVET